MAPSENGLRRPPERGADGLGGLAAPQDCRRRMPASGPEIGRTELRDTTMVRPDCGDRGVSSRHPGRPGGRAKVKIAWSTLASASSHACPRERAGLHLGFRVRSLRIDAGPVTPEAHLA